MKINFYSILLILAFFGIVATTNYIIGAKDSEYEKNYYDTALNSEHRSAIFN